VSYQVKKCLGKQFVEATVCTDGNAEEEKVHDGPEVGLVAEQDRLRLRHQVLHKREAVRQQVVYRLL